MGGLFSAPSAQRCLMSTDRDRSGSPAPLVTVSTAVRVSGEARRNRMSSPASSVDSATSSESSDGSEFDQMETASEVSSSDASNATPTTSSVVSSVSGTSLSTANEWAARSPPHKLPRFRWPFTTRRRRSSRRVTTHGHAEGDEATENGNAEVPGTSGEIIRKLREMEDALTCAICMNRRRNVVFMCGHTACRTCATQIDICHICRRPIERMIPLH
ncbi:hypothetical protein MTO96_023689 [Rhipicephalus appendiculatus]